MHVKTITDKVNAQNALAKHVNATMPLYLAWAATLQRSTAPAIKVDGTLTKASRAMLPSSKMDYVIVNRYSLAVNCKVCIPSCDGFSTEYAEQTFHVAGLEGQKVASVPTMAELGLPMRGDWTVEEVRALHAAAEAADKALREARHACGPFTPAYL